MKIEINENREICFFEDLELGAYFIYQKQLCLKSSKLDAVVLQNGRILTLPQKSTCLRVSAKVDETKRSSQECFSSLARGDIFSNNSPFPFMKILTRDGTSKGLNLGCNTIVSFSDNEKLYKHDRSCISFDLKLQRSSDLKLVEFGHCFIDDNKIYLKFSNDFIICLTSGFVVEAYCFEKVLDIGKLIFTNKNECCFADLKIGEAFRLLGSHYVWIKAAEYYGEKPCKEAIRATHAACLTDGGLIAVNDDEIVHIEPATIIEE